MTVRALRCGARTLTLDRPRVMGILNVTPDSFSDGGRHADPAAALVAARAMVEAGADLVDVGGESTRPGAAPVAEDRELDRVIPVIEAIVAELDVVVSVDTSRALVMREAAAAGAGLINDVRALRAPGALETAAACALPVCLMHMLGEPGDMQADPRYDDVVAEVAAFLVERARVAEAAGVADVVLDPGFGFGKRLEHNVALFDAVAALAPRFPVLVGVSRKGMIGALGAGPGEPPVPPAGRLGGSIGGALAGLARGASIVRAHDVAETVRAVRVWHACAGPRADGGPGDGAGDGADRDAGAAWISRGASPAPSPASPPAPPPASPQDPRDPQDP